MSVGGKEVSKSCTHVLHVSPPTIHLVLQQVKAEVHIEQGPQTPSGGRLQKGLGGLINLNFDNLQL